MALIDTFIIDSKMEAKQVCTNICRNQEVITLFNKYDHKYMFRYPYLFYYCQIQKVIYAYSAIYPKRVWKLPVRDHFQSFCDFTDSVEDIYYSEYDQAIAFFTN